MTDASFAELQSKLRQFWPSVTLRSIGDVERSRVVVHSISFDVPDHLIPVFPRLRGAVSLPRPQPAQERLARASSTSPRNRSIHVCSTTTSGSSPSSTNKSLRGRFVALSLVDGRNEPLAPQAARAPWSYPADPRADRRRGARVHFAVLHDGGRGEARRGARAPHLRLRPCAERLGTKTGAGGSSRRRASHTGRLGGGRPRELRGHSRAAPLRPCCAPGGAEARPRGERARERAGRPRRGSATIRLRPRLEDSESASRTISRRSETRAASWRSRSRQRTSAAPASSSAEPGAPGRHHVHPRPGTGWPARPDVLRLSLPGRRGVRRPDRSRSAEGRAAFGARRRHRAGLR